MKSDIKVSVLCLAYNHEKYIRKALDGLVSQETDFGFEVLIHDDASTDKTADIIREYEAKYPDIIKPIYQTENQYSKGVKITMTHLVPKAKGRYFAWCECDDYWTDPKKLQKQYDFLSKNEDYAICVHSCEYRDLKKATSRIKPYIEADRDYSIEEIIIGGGDMFATNSAMAKREVYEERPACFNAKGFGDYQLFMYGAIYGKCRCLADVMSVYNFGTEGSWTERVMNNPDARLKHLHSLSNLLHNINEYYDKKYDDAFSYCIDTCECNILFLESNYKAILVKRFKKFRKRQGFKFSLSIYLNAYFPWLMRLYKKLRHRT